MQTVFFITDDTEDPANLKLKNAFKDAGFCPENVLIHLPLNGNFEDQANRAACAIIDCNSVALDEDNFPLKDASHKHDLFKRHLKKISEAFPKDTPLYATNANRESISKAYEDTHVHNLPYSDDPELIVSAIASVIKQNQAQHPA